MIAALVYYPVFIALWIFTNTPLPFQYIFSDLAYFILFYIAGYRKKTVFENLKKSFPSKSEQELRIIAKKFYRHLCDYFIESVAILGMSEKEIRKRFTYKNCELLHELYRKKKSIILATGHYGNWEWFTSLPLVSPYHVLALYKPLNNVHYNNLFKRIREKFGAHTFPMASSLKYMMACQHQELLTLTIFLTDQRPLRKNIQYWTNFLNQETPVQLGTEKVGKKLGQAIIFGLVRKLRRGYYECEFKLICSDSSTTAEFEITDAHVKFLEDLILEKPEYWLWSHKRWKHDRVNVDAWKVALEEKKQHKNHGGTSL
jgi:Kdo2-lipid IVA lauroyltransferase/acyltransferase